jgi:hypothetical protein
VKYQDEKINGKQLKTDEGYVLLARSFIESSLFAQDEPVLRLAIYLISRANWEPKEWFCKYSNKKILIDRGQIVTSISHLAEIIPRMSRGKIRRAFSKLLADDFIKDVTPLEAKTANGYIMLSIEKYTDYQDQENYKRPSIDQRSSQRSKKNAAIDRPTSDTTIDQRSDTTKTYSIKHKTKSFNPSNQISDNGRYNLRAPQGPLFFENEKTRKSNSSDYLTQADLEVFRQRLTPEVADEMIRRQEEKRKK